jgi:hypothetical protein
MPASGSKRLPALEPFSWAQAHGLPKGWFSRPRQQDGLEDRPATPAFRLEEVHTPRTHASQKQSNGRLGFSERLHQWRSLAAVRPIEFHWSRNRLVGLFKAVTGLGDLGTVQLGDSQLSVSPHDTVKFHVVGDDEPTTRPLATLERIELG